MLAHYHLMRVSRPTTQYVLLSALSGCLWGAIAFVLSFEGFPVQIWGGVLGSPPIGIVIGLIAYYTGPWSSFSRVPLSLASLYFAAALWGLCIGVFEMLVLGIPNQIPYAGVIEMVLAVLWGLTFSGYVVLLWPLAYFNHWLLGRQACQFA